MIWKGESGQYHCTLEFTKVVNGKSITTTEERDVWLFKGETMGVHIKKVGDIIPGTRKEEWKTTDQQKPYEDLFNAIVQSAVEDIRSAEQWVDDYPKKHMRLHCKARTPYEYRMLKEKSREKDYAEGFLKGTYIGKRLKHESRKKGRDYDFQKILKSGIQTERENTRNA